MNNPHVAIGFSAMGTAAGHSCSRHNRLNAFPSAASSPQAARDPCTRPPPHPPPPPCDPLRACKCSAQPARRPPPPSMPPQTKRSTLPPKPPPAVQQVLRTLGAASPHTPPTPSTRLGPPRPLPPTHTPPPVMAWGLGCEVLPPFPRRPHIFGAAGQARAGWRLPDATAGGVATIGCGASLIDASGPAECGFGHEHRYQGEVI